MFEQFDDNLLSIIKKASEYTRKNYKINKIGTESFLYVMFLNEDSICNILLEDYRVTSDEILDVMSDYIFIRSNNKEYTDKLLEVFEMSKTIAKENNKKMVSEEHFLFALLIIKDTIFEELIANLNLNSVSLIEDLKAYFNLNNSSEVEMYTLNLTELAKENKLSKTIGRESYLDRMKIVLSRKNKNNILLVGSAGVGKTALVEGLCYDLIKSNSNFKILSLNIASLIANTKYRGDFEARINKVLAEVTEMENVIVFIDEIHTIVGAGSSDNLLDIANIIKPYLARNNFRCIGATTIEEYHKSIAKDKALARRFQPIFVNELNESETHEVLLGILDDYISYHNVNFQSKFINYIIKECKNKIVNRKFPDKAIDLMDEAMSVAKSKNQSDVLLLHIDEALKNITGANNGVLEYPYVYDELMPYFLDNYLGILVKECLVSINYEGDSSNLELLLDEIKLGFGITNEMILKINLENFTENYSISSLIGTPPGYVGYEDGGMLSEHFSKFLYQVVVVDNFEYASFDIKQLFHQILLKGFFNDKKGREFKTNNTVFIFINNNKKNENIGFINNVKKNAFEIKCDLSLHPKNKFITNNPYIDCLKYKGYDIKIDDNDFTNHLLDYKKVFLDILKEYKNGEYELKYNHSSNKIDIFEK